MALLTSSWALDGVVVISTAMCLLYAYFQHIFRFWKKFGIPQLKPQFPFGDFKNAFFAHESMAERYASIYRAFKGERFGGAYVLNEPVLVLRDPEIIKGVFVKDFSNFNSHGFFVDEKLDHFSGNLFGLYGPRWKFMRQKLSPTFTSGKMKYMFPVLESLRRELAEYLGEQVKLNPVVDVRELVARFSTDVISSVAFGIEGNTIRNPDSEFRAMGKRLFHPTPMIMLRVYCYASIHWLVRLLRITFADYKASQFLDNVVRKTVAHREQNGVRRTDFLDLLIQLKNNGDLGSTDDGVDSRPLTISEVAAQAFVFFVAGYETSAATASWTMLELAKHPDIQNKLTTELDEALKETGGKITYELLQKLPYMDTVIQESTRLYPALPILSREVTGDRVNLPGTNVILPRGQKIVIPIRAIHSDPAFYPEPHVFRPERFSEAERHQRVPFTHMPFGDGPRICIGMRFGLMQVKMSLIALLGAHRVTIPSGHSGEVGVDPRAFTLMPKETISLHFTPRIAQAG